MGRLWILEVRGNRGALDLQLLEEWEGVVRHLRAISWLLSGKRLVLWPTVGGRTSGDA